MLTEPSVGEAHAGAADVGKTGGPAATGPPLSSSIRVQLLGLYLLLPADRAAQVIVVVQRGMGYNVLDDLAVRRTPRNVDR